MKTVLAKNKLLLYLFKIYIHNNKLNLYYFTFNYSLNGGKIYNTIYLNSTLHYRRFIIFPAFLLPLIICSNSWNALNYFNKLVKIFTTFLP